MKRLNWTELTDTKKTDEVDVMHIMGRTCNIKIKVLDKFLLVVNKYNTN